MILLGLSLAVGIFAGNGDDITILGQLKGIVVIGIFAFGSSYIVLKIINMFSSFRAEDDDQLQGMDVSECGVEAYPEFKRAI